MENQGGIILHLVEGVFLIIIIIFFPNLLHLLHIYILSILYKVFICIYYIQRNLKILLNLNLVFFHQNLKLYPIVH